MREIGVNGPEAGRSERAVEIRELSEKATEGPWHVDMFPYRDVETGEPQPPQCEGICTHDEADGLAESVVTCGERDAKFIVALVNAYRSGELVHRSEIAGRSEKGEGEDEGRRAIRFAMGLEDHWDRFEFLNAFIGGDLSEWPEFTKPEPAPAQSPSTSDAEG